MFSVPYITMGTNNAMTFLRWAITYSHTNEKLRRQHERISVIIAWNVQLVHIRESSLNKKETCLAMRSAQSAMMPRLSWFHQAHSVLALQEPDMKRLTLWLATAITFEWGWHISCSNEITYRTFMIFPLDTEQIIFLQLDIHIGLWWRMAENIRDVNSYWHNISICKG